MSHPLIQSSILVVSLGAHVHVHSVLIHKEHHYVLPIVPIASVYVSMYQWLL